MDENTRELERALSANPGDERTARKLRQARARAQPHRHRWNVFLDRAAPLGHQAPADLFVPGIARHVTTRIISERCASCPTERITVQQMFPYLHQDPVTYSRNVIAQPDSEEGQARAARAIRSGLLLVMQSVLIEGQHETCICGEHPYPPAADGTCSLCRRPAPVDLTGLPDDTVVRLRSARQASDIAEWFARAPASLFPGQGEA